MSTVVPCPNHTNASVFNTGMTDVHAHQTPTIELQVQLCALLHVANIGLALSVLGVLICILVCYPLQSLFSMSELIAGHLSLIVSATLVKICYVGRCIAQYGLQLEVR